MREICGREKGVSGKLVSVIIGSIMAEREGFVPCASLIPWCVLKDAFF